MILVSGANRHDSKMFERCVDAIPAIAGLGGRPRKRPSKLHADKGYDYKRCRAHLRQRGIASRMPGEALRVASDWASIAGWWSGPTDGLQALANCESALKDGWMFTKRC